MTQLFIPLKGVYFDAFASGDKKHEYRIYGPRWNERTCQPGRQVLLSRGYGKAHRLNGVVASFQRLSFSALPNDVQESVHMIYGEAAEQNDIAVIGIDTVEEFHAHNRPVAIVKSGSLGVSSNVSIILSRLEAAGIKVTILDDIDKPDPPTKTIALQAYPIAACLETPVELPQNPHRAKKLKGRNRRKW